MEVGLDGSGRLLDVGCGPGTLTFDLAPHFEVAIGVDPDRDMLAEASREAARRQTINVRWARGLAEGLGNMGLGTFKMATFAQSFHWTERDRVAELVYDLLEPGGSLILVGHEVDGRPQPIGPGHPAIPHDVLRALVDRYLGPRRRAGQGYASRPLDRHEDVLARTRVGTPRVVYCPGRSDVVLDVDSVIAGYLSTSFAAPHLFGDRLHDFLREARAELARRSESGLYWDWPGDTALVIGRKGDSAAA
jgi:SAM-dependent methyltransferase